MPRSPTPFLTSISKPINSVSLKDFKVRNEYNLKIPLFLFTKKEYCSFLTKYKQNCPYYHSLFNSKKGFLVMPPI